MARPKQDGLRYFSFDTDFFYSDKRIKILKAKYGCDGIVLYIYLLTEIYRNGGYYIKWDEDSEDNALADLNLSYGLIKQVMAYLISRSLFTKITLADSVTVITSPGIQKRYQEATKSLKRDINVYKDIWLLKNFETAPHIKVTLNYSKSEKNDSKSEKNDSKSEKNETKEIKRNKKKLNENKINKTSKASKSPVYYPNDEKLDKTFADYVAMRKHIGKPMTDRAIELAMKKLQNLSSDVFGNMYNDKAIDILEQSIMNSWQGLFPLPEDKKQQKGVQINWDDI